MFARPFTVPKAGNEEPAHHVDRTQTVQRPLPSNRRTSYDTPNTHGQSSNISGQGRKPEPKESSPQTSPRLGGRAEPGRHLEGSRGHPLQPRL